jgi:hypothetical protein
VVVLCAVLAASAAHAQRALVIAGSVFEDRMSLAVRSHFLPAEGVTLRLYRDDGDRTPSSADAVVATTKTDRAGLYVFRLASTGEYWVAVDSHTFRANAWPEQTFGPGGSLCAQPDGTSRATYFEGSCFGGRTVEGSDDAAALTTSEHVALVAARESATSVDFAFSFGVVTNTSDGERVQGSLRQFIANANALPGPSRMRFVPVTDAPEQRATTFGLPPRWWKITLATALPEIRDDDTIIDGTAYNYLSPASVANVHPGRFGESPTLSADVRPVPRLEKPELEIVANGTTGIVCAARCAARSIALHGTATGVITRADARFEHVIVGGAPDGEPSYDGGVVGVQSESGTIVARHLFVTTQTRAGIIVGPEARIDAERIEVHRCGEPTTGGGVILLSDGSSIRSSTIATNPGAGIVLGAPDGSEPARANSIDGCTISGNQAGVVLAPGSSRNVITRNDMMWNRLGGVTVTPYEEKPPRENRVSANRFDENGLRPIVLNLEVENPNLLARGVGNCTRTPAIANDGIAAPRITNVRVTEENGLRVTLRGSACPGQIVELYQSFVTSGVVTEKEKAEMPHVRGERIEQETLTTDERTFGLPSIGEFNYLGATNTAADGTFEATFPLPLVTAVDIDDQRTLEETDVWATQVLQSAQPWERAFSGIAIDTLGNTSEMSVRRKAD